MSSKSSKRCSYDSVKSGENNNYETIYSSRSSKKFEVKLGIAFNFQKSIKILQDSNFDFELANKLWN